MGLAGVAPPSDPTQLPLLLHLSHIQSSFLTNVACIYLWDRGEIVGVGRSLSMVGTEEGYRASRMVRGLEDIWADACSGWGSDRPQRC
jgi:hypothetical protein